MRTLSFTRRRTAAFALGCVGALLLLTLVSRPGAAEKQHVDDCLSANDSVCRMVETCVPHGFEANGTCKWNYTVSRSYWKF